VGLFDRKYPTKAKAEVARKIRTGKDIVDYRRKVESSIYVRDISERGEKRFAVYANKWCRGILRSKREAERRVSRLRKKAMDMASKYFRGKYKVKKKGDAWVVVS